MTTSINGGKSQIPKSSEIATFDSSSRDMPRFQFSGSETFLAGPFQFQSPGIITNPVTDKVSSTGIDQDSNTGFEKVGYVRIARFGSETVFE